MTLIKGKCFKYSKMIDCATLRSGLLPGFWLFAWMLVLPLDADNREKNGNCMRGDNHDRGCQQILVD